MSSSMFTYKTEERFEGSDILSIDDWITIIHRRAVNSGFDKIELQEVVNKINYMIKILIKTFEFKDSENMLVIEFTIKPSHLNIYSLKIIHSSVNKDEHDWNEYVIKNISFNCLMVIFEYGRAQFMCESEQTCIYRFTVPDYCVPGKK